MKIYTGRGDQGKTSLWGGETVAKDSPRVCAYGTVDELNALLGAARAVCADTEIHTLLISLQNGLFRAGADLAAREGANTRIARIGQEDWRRLEGWIDSLEEQLPPLNNFILPGGTSGAALLHLARTVCRRAEREAAALLSVQEINSDLLIYLNRLSDLLFVMARYENLRGGSKEEIWRENA